MKTVLIALLALGLTACGEGYKLVPTEVIVEKEVEVDNTPPVSVRSEQKFEGLYYFEEVGTGEVSGPLEVITRYNGQLNVTQSSRNKLRSQNFNLSYGTHPAINFQGAVAFGPEENAFTYAGDVNYASNDDLEKDGTTSDLGSGRKFTIYEFEIKNDRLELTIKIHENASNSNGGINDIVVERSFREVR